MGTVHSFVREEEVEPAPITSEGVCVCLDCKHEWMGMADVETEWLECPGCGLFRGRFKFQHTHFEEEHWACVCGNDLFHITQKRTYCPNCGRDHTW
jgi:Zn finger protein HypA/HybF involved in hydrogenase expression